MNQVWAPQILPEHAPGGRAKDARKRRPRDVNVPEPSRQLEREQVRVQFVQIQESPHVRIREIEIHRPVGLAKRLPVSRHDRYARCEVDVDIGALRSQFESGTGQVARLVGLRHQKGRHRVEQRSNRYADLMHQDVFSSEHLAELLDVVGVPAEDHQRLQLGDPVRMRSCLPQRRGAFQRPVLALQAHAPAEELMTCGPSPLPTFSRPIAETRQPDHPSMNFLAPTSTLTPDSGWLISEKRDDAKRSS